MNNTVRGNIQYIANNYNQLVYDSLNRMQSYRHDNDVVHTDLAMLLVYLVDLEIGISPEQSEVLHIIDNTFPIVDRYMGINKIYNSYDFTYIERKPLASFSILVDRDYFFWGLDEVSADYIKDIQAIGNYFILEYPRGSESHRRLYSILTMMDDYRCDKLTNRKTSPGIISTTANYRKE